MVERKEMRTGEHRYNRVMKKFRDALAIAATPYDGSERGTLLCREMAEFCQSTVANFEEDFSGLVYDDK